MKQVKDKGGVDLGGRIQISGGATYEISVILSTKTASLEGTVTSETKWAKTVMIFPDTPGPSMERQTFLTDTAGRYKFERIVPGRYNLFAFDGEIPHAAFGNKDLVQSIINKGISISLKESSRETKDLPVTELP